MTDREKVDAKRNEIVQSILGYIEQHPTNWLSGWVSLGVPQNGLTNSNYRGLNALYLWLIGKQQGYTDNRWVTFNQAKELGASVKKGEKSSPILFYTLYDKNTKKEYTRKTTADMTDEERKKYEDENVRPVVRYSQVFNAQQCANFPERAATSLMSDEERQKHSNDVIERIIANSEAPILYDGGDRAFYRITTDDIHLPAIEQFNTMQDYYATALHEIAHSTGHPSRLNRKMGGADRENYAIEELRAEMAAVFMQMENGIQLEGKHYENHSAYLASWLEEVKNDTKIFTSAVSDAMKISDYVTEHYVNKAAVATLDEQSVTVAAEQERTNDDLNVAIKAYYMHAFPTDDAGQDIPDGVTFKDFNEYLTTGDYESAQACFVNDSVVRERLFARLAKITNQKYNDVYNQWLNIYENSQSSAAGTVDDTKEKAALATRFAILEAARKVANDDMSYVDAKYIEPYQDIHFAFFEKEPKHRDKNGILGYTKKGTISQNAIDNYMVSANLYLDEHASEYYSARDEAMDNLKDVRADVAKGIRRDMRLNMAIDHLISNLPKNGRLQYNSENMAALRPEIDNIAKMLINSDVRTKESHLAVLKQFARIEQSIQDLVKENKMVYVDDRRLSKDEIKAIEKNEGQDMTKSIDISNIDYLPKIKQDYNARLGNIVLGLCKEIMKGDYKERKSKAKANAGRAKLASRRQHEWRGHLLQNALTSIVLQDERLQMNFLKSVQQIENEMKYSDGTK